MTGDGVLGADLSGSVGALSAAVLGAALDVTGLAMVITDAGLDAPGPVIRYANAHMEAITGYAAAELIGRSPRLLQGPETDRAELDRMRRELPARRHFVGAVVNYRKDGTTYLNEWVVAAILGPDGAVSHWLSLQRDATAAGQPHPRSEGLRQRTETILATLRAIAARQPPAPAQGRLLGDRMDALSRAQAGDGGLESILASELGAWPMRVSLEGPPVILPPGLAAPLALVLHELAGNAIRRGALAVPTGRLSVSWRRVSGRLVIEWRESGVPGADAGALRDVYGPRVLEEALAFALGGEMRVRTGSDGLACTVSVPFGD